MNDAVTLEVRDGVAVLTIDRPPVNAIDVAVRAGLIAGVGAVVSRSDIKAAVIACAGRTFLSGADLGELGGGGVAEPGYHAMLSTLEGCPKPVVAALFGTALGGGVETAMACHYRVAAADSKIGMPEINLGILPGAEGTQRLPRLVGAQAALTMMVEGAPIPAQKALAIGLVDEVVEGDVVEAAVAVARRLVAEGQGPRRTSELPVSIEGFDAGAVLAKYSRNLKGRTTQHQLVRLVETAATTSFADGIEVEREASADSLKSPEGRALIHVFFAERECGRIPGLSGAKAPPIDSAAVVGAGTMGSGIATAFADAGVPVTLIEAKPAALERGLGLIRSNFDASAKRGRITPAEAEARMALIQGALSIDACAEADVIVEAVFEDMALKKEIAAAVDRAAKPGALIATNTSSLSLTEIAAATSRPADVVGLHFFVPAHVMRLLEIVRGEKSSPESLVRALAVAKLLRKIGVVVGDGFGFVGNRMMLDGFWREAEQLMLEGARPEDVDGVAEAFGFGMGPSRVNDMAGVDIGTKVRAELLKRERRADPYHVISDALTARGRHGQKTGKGVYRYEPGDRTAIPDPETIAIIEGLAAERGIARRADISDAEIEERCVLALINVGAQILEEGLAYRASDIDVIWTSGYGFPRWRGGPMFYADELGLVHVLKRIRHYQARLGDYWTASPLIERLAASGLSFKDWDRDGKGA